MAGKRFEVKFEINGMLTGNFANALKAAMAQMNALKNTAGKTSAAMSEQMKQAAAYLAQLQKMQANANKYSELKQQLPQNQAALKQQHQNTADLLAKYKAEEAAAASLKQRLDELNAARNAAKINATQTLPNDLNKLREREKLLQKQFNLLSRIDLNKVKDGFERRDNLKRQLQEVQAAIAAQKNLIASAKAEYKNLGEQVKQTAKQLSAAQKGLKSTGQDVNKSRQQEKSLYDKDKKMRGEIANIGKFLAQNSFDPKNFIESEKRLRAEINDTIKLIERQRAEELKLGQLSQYLSESKKGVQADIRARQQADTFGRLNAGARGLRAAYADLQRLNVQPITEMWRKLPFGTAAPVIPAGGFAKDLQGLQQLMSAAQAYRTIKGELRDNKALFQGINGETAQAARAVRQQEQAIQRLRGELERYTAAYSANKNKLSAADSAKVADNIKAMTAELSNAEKVLTRLQRNFEMSKASGAGLKETIRGQYQTLHDLKASLSSAGINASNFIASEMKLKAMASDATRALERQAQVQSLLDRYAAARKASQADIAAYQKADTKARAQQAKEYILGKAAQIRGMETRGRQLDAEAILNSNLTALQRAQYELQLRNATPISTIKPIAPLSSALTQTQKLTGKISEGKFFGTGLERLQQVQTLANAYKNLSGEFRTNYQASKKVGETIKSIESRQQGYSNTVANLRTELNKYQSAYDANKKNLSAESQYQALEKIKAITAELTQAEKTLNQLGKNLDAARGNKQNLASAMQLQLQQLKQLRTTLSGEGFSTSNFVASEQRLKAAIEETTRALERQAQVQSLLDRYAAARKASQADINVAKSRYKAGLLPTDAEKTAAQLALDRYNTTNARRKHTAALVNLNANSAALNRAWNLISRLNTVNADLPKIEKIKPLTENLKAVQKLNTAIKQKGFGEGLTGQQNILNAAQAYKMLWREMSNNRTVYKGIQADFVTARRNYQVHQNAVRMLQAELTRLKNSYTANKKILSADESAAAVANIKSMAAELSNAQRVLTQLERQMKALGNNRQGVGNAIHAQISELRTLQSLLNGAGFATANFGNSEMRLRSQIESATQAMERQAAVTERLNTAQNNFNDAQSNFWAAKNFASTILSPFTSSVEVAQEFEKEMSFVKALTQMDNLRAGNLARVNDEMTQLTTLAKTEGLRTQFTAADAARGEKYLAYSGWTEHQISEALPQMLDVATAAGMEDLGRVAEIVSDMMMAFRLKPEEAQRAADVLTYTFTHSNQNLEQLYETMKYAAPISVGFGSSFEETAAMSKFMVDAGVKGSMAGTSMRALMTRLVAPPKTITKTLQDNGLTLDDANKAWIAANEVMEKELGTRLDENLTAGQQMASVIRQINVRLKDKTNQEKMAIFKAITGLYGLSGGMNLFDVGGQMVADPDNKGQQITRLELFTRQLENSKGATEQTAAVMRDNYWGAIKALESAWEGVKLELGEAVAPTLRAVAEAVTPLVKGLILFSREHPRVVQAAAAIAAGLAAMAVSVTGAALAFAAFELIGAQMAAFRLGLTGADVAAAGFAARMGMLARAFKGLAIWSTLLPLLKFSGWSKIFAGLRGLTFAGVAAGLGSTLVSAAKGAASAITGIATAFRVATVAGLSFVFSPIGAALAAIALAAYAVYKNWDNISPVMDSLGNTMSARITPAIDSMTNALDGAAKAWASLFNIKTDGVTDLLVKGFIVAAKVISQVMLAIVHFVANGVAAIANLFGALADLMSAVVNRDWSKVTEANIKANAAAENFYNALIDPARDIMAIPEDINKTLSFHEQVKKANRIAENSKAVTKVDTLTGEIYVSPTQKAAARHALQYDAESNTLHSQKLTQEDINLKAEQIRRAEVSKIQLPTMQAIQRHRQDARPETISAGSRALKESKAVDSAQIAKELARIRQRESLEKFTYTPAKNYELPKFTVQPPQPTNQNSNLSASLESLLFSKAAAATPESAQLNTTTAQAQIDALGTTAQTNSTTLQATGAAAQNTAFNFQNVGTAAQMFNTSLQTTNSAAMQLSGNFINNNSAVAQNSANFFNNSSSVQQNSAAMQNSVGSIFAMSGAAQNSTGSISSLAGASASASGSISGLGAAAQSAISSLLSAGASAAASIGNAVGGALSKLNISKNAKGGIYNHGAFLTWFAEKSPEAAIPLDGSERAINLWQTAGQLLGVYPAENANGGIYKNGGQSISVQKISAKNGNVDLNVDVSNKGMAESAKNFSNATQQYSNIVSTQKKPSFWEEFFKPTSTRAQERMDETLKAGRAGLPEKVKQSKSYEALNKPTAQNAPTAATAPQQWGLQGVVSNVLKGNWLNAIGGVIQMTRRKKEIESWNESQSSPQQQETASTPKTATEEKSEKVKKSRHNQKAAWNTALGIGGALLLNKVTGGGQRGKVDALSAVLAPTLGKVFEPAGSQQQSGTFQPTLTKNIVSPQGQKKQTLGGIIEQIFTPTSTRAQGRMQGQLDAARAGLPEKVKQSKSYEALNKPTAQNAPQAATAPQQWGLKGIISNVLSGNWKGALSTAGQMYSRKIEIENWNKQQGSTNQTPPAPILHAQATAQEQQKKRGSIAGIFQNVFGGGGKKEYDELGNIKGLKGNKENTITADDSKEVAEAKKAAQEKEYKKQKRQETQQAVWGTLGNAAIGFGLNKIMGGGQKGGGLKSAVLGAVLTPVLGKIFSPSQKAQQDAQKPVAETAPTQAAAQSAAAAQNQSAAQAETSTAGSASTFNSVEKPAPNNAPAEMPPITLNFTINIQGNANQQDVENGVKETIPFIRESFESQMTRFIHERQRRGFL